MGQDGQQNSGAIDGVPGSGPCPQLFLTPMLQILTRAGCRAKKGKVLSDTLLISPRPRNLGVAVGKRPDPPKLN